MYKTEKSFDVIKGIVPNFRLKKGNITLAYTIDGSTNSSSFPNKQDGYIAESITCENSVQAEWDNISWSLKNIRNPQKSSKISCTINFNRSYKDTILNGADPILDSEGKLVPVIIGDNGKVTKADVTKEWYNYKNRVWANAVILTENGKSKNYQNNAEISEDDIESYFVWIPKYRYKIFDMGNTYTTLTSVQSGKVQEIEIEFGIYDTVDNTIECTTPPSGENGSCAIDKWMTHPAFTAFPNSKGLWVGKFETGYKGANSAADAQKNESNSSNVIIKPDAYSWRNISMKNAFDASFYYQRDLDSHMMKNTEWGAVAYLTQSIYGRCTSSNECTEVTLNGNTNYTTGYSSTNIPYTTNTSVASSTTNNYSGIYDMSGGAWEYTMAVMKGTNSSSFTFGNSGFTLNNIPFKTSEELDYSKYYDVYLHSTSATTYNRRILGDATGEMGPFASNNSRPISSWYNDEAWFFYSSNPLNVRGGNYTASGGGVFAFSYGSIVTTASTFRIVLSPNTV